jgi:type I restriction enzyme S subunit
VRENGDDNAPPASWAVASLNTVAEINPPLAREIVDAEAVSFVPMAAVEEQTGRLDPSIVRPFGEVKKGFTRFQDGDLVFAKITPSMENGKVALATHLRNGIGCGTTELHVVRPKPGIASRYLLHYLLQSSFREVAKRNMKGTAGQFLTRDWRAQNKGQGETGADLLRRVLAARRETWEKTRKSKEYKEAVAPDTPDLPNLPDEWVIASCDQLSAHLTSGSRAWSKFYGRGTSSFIMAQNVRPARFDMSTRQTVEPPKGDPETARTLVRKDDLLITIVGANTGDVCRVPVEVDRHYVCQSVALLRPALTALSRYLEIYLTAEEGGQRTYKRYIYGAGRPHMSFDQLRQTPVALPGLGEQAEICARVDEALSDIDAAYQQITKQAAISASLRQSILRAAFSGRLVPQDPADEPAAALLQRIAAERAQAPAAKRAGPPRARRR